MANLILDKQSVDFWVWINPDNWLVRHQITFTGSFTSGGVIQEKKSNEEEAYKYGERHKWHVGDRKLKKCYSKISLGYSIHDSSWVDFLRLSHSVDNQSLDYITRAYWSGQKVEDCTLQSMGKPWTEKPILEVLFLGRVEFYDRVL